MANKKKSEIGVLRMLAVLLGVLGAGWLFFDAWQGVFDFVGGYKLSQNFFSYFFSTGLFPVALLSCIILFFTVSLRDLEPLTGFFSVLTIILSAVAGVACVMSFVSGIKTFDVVKEPSAYINLGRIMFVAAYLFFAIYCINRGKIRNAAWGFVIAAIVLILFGTIYGFAVEKVYVNEFVHHIITLAAHGAMFFCGLRRFA
ncbi:MAG: hypothetical protein ILO53_05060 [Clostridia bacterium]|nr:hypothetical protein [Clostridia bacterium]